MSQIFIPGRLVNKANSYEIHINPSLWKRIKATVEAWKAEVKQSSWWIAPSKDAQSWEEAAAYTILGKETRRWNNNEPLRLNIWLRNQRHDADAVKAIGDAFQRAHVINNDKQFRQLVVVHIEGQAPAVILEVKEL